MKASLGKPTKPWEKNYRTVRSQTTKKERKGKGIPAKEEYSNGERQGKAEDFSQENNCQIPPNPDAFGNSYDDPVKYGY